MTGGAPSPASRGLRCLSAKGFHRMVYHQWGPDGAARVVICVHGLTRNGRDFDRLAAALAVDGVRVIAPDVVGRGQSDWLTGGADYGMPQYLADMTALIARLDVEEVDWVGTSMGGLIGMTLAAQPNTPLRRLVLNDVGPFIPSAALERIAGYVGQDLRFADMAAAEAHLRTIHEGFGDLSDADWRHLTETNVAPAKDDGLRLRYDPAIANAFREQPIEDVDLWGLWDRVTCPTLVLRGERSDLLLAATAAEMAARGRRAEVVEIAGCGHAPALMSGDQIGLLQDWLSR